MTLRTTRRLLVGFAAGIATGWFAGLLRTPRDAPPTSSAADAAALPQEEFGPLPEPALEPESR